MNRRTFWRQASLPLLASVYDSSYGLIPESNAKTTLRIGICSDLHHDLVPDSKQRLTRFIDAMNQQNVDFIIQLGDFCVPKPANRSIIDVWNRFKGPAYHVIGNHETDGGFTHQQVVDFWGAKGAYYSVNHKGYHFVVLNGNEKNPAGPPTGYPRYIGPEQRRWLATDLATTKLPTIVFCHQGLDNDLDGIERGLSIRRLFERANEQAGFQKVQLVFSGHHHLDYHNQINGIHYVQINSMSYYWVGERRNPSVYDAELVQKYPYVNAMARYKDPLWAVVTVQSNGEFIIQGKQSVFLDVTPALVGLTEDESVYPVVASISNRRLNQPS